MVYGAIWVCGTRVGSITQSLCGAAAGSGSGRPVAPVFSHHVTPAQVNFVTSTRYHGVASEFLRIHLCRLQCRHAEAFQGMRDLRSCVGRPLVEGQILLVHLFFNSAIYVCDLFMGTGTCNSILMSCIYLYI